MMMMMMIMTMMMIMMMKMMKKIIALTQSIFNLGPPDFRYRSLVFITLLKL